MAPRAADAGRAKRTLAPACEVVARWIPHKPAWRMASSMEIRLREIRKRKEKKVTKKRKTKRLKKEKQKNKIVLVVGNKDKRT